MAQLHAARERRTKGDRFDAVAARRTQRLAVTAYSGHIAADEWARQWSLLTIKWMWPSMALLRCDNSTSSARHTRSGPLHGWRGVAFRQQETVMLRRLAGVRSVATVPVMRGMPIIAVMMLAGCRAAPLADGAVQSTARFAYGDAVAADVQAIVNGMDAAEGRRRLVLLLKRAVPIEE
jgi:hypothetical protein